MDKLDTASEPMGSRVADSMAAAVAMLLNSANPAERLTEDEMKRAKEAGCPAFRGSRVRVDDLLEWWDEHGDALPTGNKELNAIQLQIAREKLRKVRYENDVEEAKYIRRDEVAPMILALGLTLKATLRKRLEEDFPDRQTMRTREEIIAINRTLVDELCREFEGGTKQWSR